MQTYSIINTGSGLDATVIHGKSVKLFGIDCMNNGAAAVYLKLYDKATAPTTSDTPARRYMIPITGGLVRLFGTSPLLFTAGLGFSLTANIADNDNNNVSASNVLINIDWG